MKNPPPDPAFLAQFEQDWRDRYGPAAKADRAERARRQAVARLTDELSRPCEPECPVPTAENDLPF